MAEESTLLPLANSAKTCTYKTVGDIKIEIEVLPPKEISYASDNSINVLLYIHVGGWIAGSRLDYPQTLVHETLSQGWVFASMDHRLLPETSLNDQFEDIRDVEGWLRNDLVSQIHNRASDARIGDIVIAGGSAGGHLALLTVHNRFLSCSCGVLKLMINQI